MSAKINLEGQKFNKLTVLNESPVRKRNLVTWNCLCDCGNYCLATTQDLRIGDTKSCGCLIIDTCTEHLPKPTHNYKNHILYNTWKKMIDRCYNENSKDYYLYGKRGILVCDDWKNIPVDFCNWGVNNGYKKGLTIDRINTNGNYSPENCRWATNNEQARNKRNNINITINGRTQCLKDWCAELDINYSTAKQWGNRGKNIKEKIEERIINDVI